jgi:uncharacterized phage-associated protein
MTPEFNADKFRELILSITDRSREDARFGLTKLNKLMFYTDFGCYLLLGKPATGATYEHWPAGPVAKEMRDQKAILIEGEFATIERRPYFNGVQERIVPIKHPDLAAFSDDEIAIIDQVVEFFWFYNATQISDFSHMELGWRVTEDRQTIPYETAWISPEPLSAEQIELGQRIAAGVV